MIIEFFRHILTPSPTHLREMGYLRELIAIQARYKRCAAAWESHCTHSKQEILDMIERCPQKRIAVVLGAGLLNDVPVEELSRAFRELWLVDILHIPETQKRLAHLPNIRFVTHDITECVQQLYDLAQLPKNPAALPTAPLPQFLRNEGELDLVCSVNILSQLPIMPSLYLEKKAAYTDAELQLLKRSLIQAHLDWLYALPTSVLLICDVEEMMQESNGSIVDRESSTEGIALPPHRAEWLWNIAPRPEAYRQYDVVHRVQSIIINEATT